jgi:hypothetical protein
LGDLEAKAFAYPMVCFCDIPLSRISEHVDYYGKFGIGLTREWAIKNGLNPIFYISRSSPIGGAMLEGMRTIIQAEKVMSEKKAEESLKGKVGDDERHADKEVFNRVVHVLAHMKPLTGQIVVAGTPIEKAFYLENEWRYVPRAKGEIAAFPADVFEDENARKGINDRLMVEGCLRFLPSDVIYVFVPTDADIPALVDFMTLNLAHLSVADMKILTTRITSLETLNRDM